MRYKRISRNITGTKEKQSDQAYVLEPPLPPFGLCFLLFQAVQRYHVHWYELKANIIKNSDPKSEKEKDRAFIYEYVSAWRQEWG